MPLYEYKCNACAHRFERIVKFSDAPLKTCPLCGEDAIDQLISAPAVQFKGSGWYVTDYARKSSAPSGSGSPKSDGGSEAVSASKDNGNGNGSSGATSDSSSSEKTSGDTSASKSDNSGSSQKSSSTAVAESK